VLEALEGHVLAKGELVERRQRRETEVASQ
jgi:hypothetical protein